MRDAKEGQADIRLIDNIHSAAKAFNDAISAAAGRGLTIKFEIQETKIGIAEIPTPFIVNLGAERTQK